MITVSRLGNSWASATDPKTGELVLIHLDSLRQEVSDPLESSAIVSTFSFYRRPQPGEGEVVKPTADNLKQAKRFPNEVVLLMGMADGENPARLFDQVVYVLFAVLFETHPPMTYEEYQLYLKQTPRYGRNYLALPNPSSPTGRFAVWNILFTRTYGLNAEGVFTKLSAKAKYRFGYMGGVEVFPGTIYNFPQGFMLERSVEGHDFIELMANLLTLASQSEDVAKVEPYWVK
jgi:hypothetical protein